nr:hypothetical protein [Tanacetum cinerariifolium]
TLHEDFQKCTYFELVVYRRRLLHYLDELEKLLKEGTLKDGELQLKEKAVKVIKEIEKWLKEKEKQTQESMVIGTLLVSQGSALDAKIETKDILSTCSNLKNNKCNKFKTKQKKVAWLLSMMLSCSKDIDFSRRLYLSHWLFIIYGFDICIISMCIFPDLLLVSCSTDSVPLLFVSTKLASNA